MTWLSTGRVRWLLKRWRTAVLVEVVAKGLMLERWLAATLTTRLFVMQVLQVLPVLAVLDAGKEQQ